jgi:hypothetical protein
MRISLKRKTTVYKALSNRFHKMIIHDCRRSAELDDIADPFRIPDSSMAHRRVKPRENISWKERFDHGLGDTPDYFAFFYQWQKTLNLQLPDVGFSLLLLMRFGADGKPIQFANLWFTEISYCIIRIHLYFPTVNRLISILAYEELDGASNTLPPIQCTPDLSEHLPHLILMRETHLRKTYEISRGQVSRFYVSDYLLAPRNKTFRQSVRQNPATREIIRAQQDREN